MSVIESEIESSSLADDLITQVQSSLGKLSYNQLDNVDCALQSSGHVTLSGQLKSYYLKQIAHTIALKVPGVRRVTNNILVMEQ